MSGTTGTDADRFSVNRGGSRAATLSITLRYMHLPCEVIDPADCMAVSQLIAAFLRGEIE
jgi:endoglucanase